MTRRPSLFLPSRPRLAVASAALAALTGLCACAPVIIGGAMVGSALVASDRRTSGTQLEDQTIELKARSRLKDVFPDDRAHVNVTSYNRIALLTGEAPTEADKALAAATVAQVENVRSVVNELAIAGYASLTSRSSDTLITSKVKATFVDAKDLMANSVKVVTERGTVYLMGRVTEREASRATELTRSVGGVQKVVRVFEILTEAELAAMPPVVNAASAPATPTTPPGENAVRTP